MIFIDGDKARYVGGSQRSIDKCEIITNGDECLVARGNEDMEDDVTIHFDGCIFTVDPGHLQWIES